MKSKVRGSKSTGANTGTVYTWGEVASRREGTVWKSCCSVLRKGRLALGSSWHVKRIAAACPPHTEPQSSSSLPCPYFHPTCPSARLTHGRCCQCLSTHNLAWSQAIQKITELAFSSEPRGKNKPAEGSRGHLRAAGGPGVGRWVDMEAFQLGS